MANHGPVISEVVRYIAASRGIRPKYAIRVYGHADKKTRERWRKNAEAAIARRTAGEPDRG